MTDRRNSPPPPCPVGGETPPLRGEGSQNSPLQTGGNSPFPRRAGDRGVRWLALLLLSALLLWPAAALAQSSTPGEPVAPALRDVGFDPHLDRQLPADLVFNDENGQAVRLGDYFRDANRPIILTLNYYHCENLCPLALQSLVDQLVQVPFKLGDDYTMLTVSIDPHNTAADATDMKTELIHRYARRDALHAAGAWHFLTGDETSIEKLAQTVGFKYAWDPVQNDYAHPIGAILLTPDGRTARYLYGMDFPVTDLRLGIVEASQRKISTPVEAVLLLCYHYSLTAGRYSATVMNLVRAVGILTLLALGSFIGIMIRRDLRGRGRPAGGSGA
jgi:protein SCO1